MTQPLAPAPGTRRWAPLAVVAAAAVAGTIVTVVVLTGRGDNSSPVGVNPLSLTTPLESAATTCAAGTLADENTTLLIDMEGEEYGSGTESFDDVICVLNELSAPDSIVARMNSTRALDGMQNAHWDTHEATWTYHPDDGLDLILTETH